MAEEWRKVLPKHIEGEAGVVYYINVSLTFTHGDEWTMGNPFTLNPKYGRTLYDVLKKSNSFKNDMKRDLMRRRISERQVLGDHWFRVWISEHCAPKRWNPEAVKHATQYKEKLEQQNRPVLLDHKGEALK